MKKLMCFFMVLFVLITLTLSVSAETTGCISKAEIPIISGGSVSGGGAISNQVTPIYTGGSFFGGGAILEYEKMGGIPVIDFVIEAST